VTLDHLQEQYELETLTAKDIDICLGDRFLVQFSKNVLLASMPEIIGVMNELENKKKYEVYADVLHIFPEHGKTPKGAIIYGVFHQMGCNIQMNQACRLFQEHLRFADISN
jgi:hypothetical protein